MTGVQTCALPISHRGGYHRKPKTNGEGLKPSEIIAASPELLALIAEYQRDKRKEAD